MDLGVERPGFASFVFKAFGWREAFLILRDVSGFLQGFRVSVGFSGWDA